MAETETATAAAAAAAAAATQRANQLQHQVDALRGDQVTWARQAAEAKAASNFLDACAAVAEQLAQDAETLARNCQLRATGRSEYATVCAVDSAIPSKTLWTTAQGLRSVVDAVGDGWTGETATAYTGAARKAIDAVQVGTLRIESWYRQVGANAGLIADRAREKATGWRGDAVVQRRVVAARNDSISAANRRITTLNGQIADARADAAA